MLTIIASMEYELVGLRRELQLRAHAFGKRMPAAWRHVWADLHVIGVGRPQGETAVRSLLRREGEFGGYSGPPERLLILGFAGAVDPALETGTLVLSSRYYRAIGGADPSVPIPSENPSLPPSMTSSPNHPSTKGGKGEIPSGDPPSSQREVEGSYLVPDPVMWRRGVAAATAINQAWADVDSLTVDHLVTTPKAKRAIRRQYPVGVVNMEDSWVAEAAQEAGVPFLSARVVLDRADQSLPGYLPAMARSHTKAVITTAAMPWRIPTLLGLARRLPRAQDVLTWFAFNYLVQLISGEDTQPNPAPDTSAVATGSD